MGYLVRRLLFAIPTVFGVVTLVFLLVHVIPGDPVEVMLGEMAQPADKAALRRELGLDQPLWRQYITFLWRLGQGNLGVSLHTQERVSRLVFHHYPATLELALAAMILAVIWALPLGILAAARPRSVVDYLSVGVALGGVAVPNFWLGPMLILLFSIHLGWFPVSGRGTLRHVILPAVTLGTAMAAILARMTRATLLENLGEDYIRSARAKGLSEARVFVKHALRNALTVVVTLIGLQFGSLLAGAIITETIFSWPGLGRLTLQAIHARDYPLVQGCVLVIAVSYVIVNLVTDLTYAAIDPRIRYRK